MTDTTKRIPRSECIQGTCVNVTTGCWGECSIRAAFPLNNVACGDAVAQPRVSEQGGERIAQYVPGEWFDARTLDEMQAFYLSRLQSIREAAEEHGYAIGLHGSTRRDFDLMAMQWRKDASDKDTLAHAIANAACGIARDGPYQWEQKPNGRFAVSIPICWTEHGNPEFGDKPSLGHIDLSVIEARACIAYGASPAAADNFAVNFIEQRAAEYLRDHASTEHDTGATIWHHGEAGRDYHSNLVELADDLRAAITQQAAPEAPTLPECVIVWVRAEQAVRAASDAHNAAFEESAKEPWPGRDLNPEYQVLSKAQSKAHHAKLAMFDALTGTVAAPEAPASEQQVIANVAATLERAGHTPEEAAKLAADGYAKSAEDRATTASASGRKEMDIWNAGAKALAEIKKWQERAFESGVVPTPQCKATGGIELAMEAEIAGLRAALAQQSAERAAGGVDGLSDDDLWHIAGIVSSMAGGSLFNVSQHECVTAIRAGFMDPDAASEYTKARATHPGEAPAGGKGAAS